jgi:hypothetical protein
MGQEYRHTPKRVLVRQLPSSTTFTEKPVAVFNASQIEMNRKVKTALEHGY